MVISLAIVGLLATAGVALANAPEVVAPTMQGYDNGPFNCPAIGAAGAMKAADKNPNLLHPLGESGYYTLLPGHNQAGLHANYHAWNGVSAYESRGPVLDENWSPIWPSDTPK